MIESRDPHPALPLINQRLGFRFRDTEREEERRLSPLIPSYNATIVGTVNPFADLTVFLFVRLDADLVSLSLSPSLRAISRTTVTNLETEKRYKRVSGSVWRRCAPLRKWWE